MAAAAEWKVGADAKNLRNLYVYFWRWAAWKVFEQGAGGRDKEPPVEENLSGIICYITVSGFLKGPGFQKMRADLRRDCDDIWVIDCSPEGHQPEVATRIFQGVQHPVCIVLASRSPANNPKVPAPCALPRPEAGQAQHKFKELASVTLGRIRLGQIAPSERRSAIPAPTCSGSGRDFIELENVLGDAGSWSDAR